MREGFKSRLGFILVSAGCAIGIGNVWRFPYVVGANGGGIFVLFYILFLLFMGIPVLTMELAVGRASGQSAINAFKTLEKPKHKWHIHGWVCLIGSILLMMYYTTVSGWMIGYFVKFLKGDFAKNMTPEQIENVFSSFSANPLESGLFMAIAVAVGFIVCSFGIQKGIERITKVMMLALLALIVILAVNSLLLSGAKEGLKFYFLPNFETAKQVGLRNIITAAMSQAFFTLSIGIASMEIFGSYMKKDRTLAGESVQICVLDTFVAVASGLIIFPAFFTYMSGTPTTSGPALIFETLPNIFVNMAGGRIWGTLFFLFMIFASLSTVIAVFENVIATCIDSFRWSRKKASNITGAVIFVASIPCVLGFSLWKNVQIAGKNILDMEDFVVSNLLLPIGCLVFLFFCVTKFGWGFDNYIAEANAGKGLKIPKWFKYYFMFVLPVMIAVVLIQGLI